MTCTMSCHLPLQMELEQCSRSENDAIIHASSQSPLVEPKPMQLRSRCIHYQQNVGVLHYERHRTAKGDALAAADSEDASASAIFQAQWQL